MGRTDVPTKWLHLLQNTAAHLMSGVMPRPCFTLSVGYQFSIGLFSTRCICLEIAFSALTLLVGHQEECTACKVVIQLVWPIWYLLTQVVLKQKPLNGCLSAFIWKCICVVALPGAVRPSGTCHSQLQSAWTGCIQLATMRPSTRQLSFAFCGPVVNGSMCDNSLSLNSLKQKLATSFEAATYIVRCHGDISVILASSYKCPNLLT